MALFMFGIELLLWVLLAYRVIGLAFKIYWLVFGVPREYAGEAADENSARSVHPVEARVEANKQGEQESEREVWIW